MSRRGRRILLALVAGGVLIRLVPAFATVGIQYDIDSFQMAADRLQQGGPLHLYGDLMTPYVRWPYPTGYFPMLLLADWVATWSGLPFHGLLHLPPIGADVGLAWVVQTYLGRRGAVERTRLAAASLVLFGPSFLVLSGYEAQIDSVAILPAAAGLLVWDRLPVGRRAVAAGVLIGLGGAIKTVPLLMVLALLPRVRGRREGLALVTGAAAVPLCLLAPWLLADPGGTSDALRYTGVNGIGGLSLAAQPGYAEAWLVTERFPDATALTQTVYDLRLGVAVLGLAGIGAFLLRTRPEPATAAMLVWLTVFATAVSFGPRYVVWVLPFALMAGRLREVAVAQAIAAPAALLIAARPWDAAWVAPLYVVLMYAILAASLAGIVALVRRPGSRYASR